MAWRLPRVAVVAVFLTVAFWLAYKSLDRLPFRRHGTPPPEPGIEIPRYEIWGIRDFREVIDVTSIHARQDVRSTSLQMREPADIPIRFTQVNLTKEIPELDHQIATIPVEKHIAPDASHLMIGMATKLDRLRDALPAYIQWASGTKVRFIIVYEPQEQSQTTAEQIQQLFDAHDISLTLVESSLNWYDAYVSLLAVLYDHATPSTKWAAIVDDDTYFFSMKRLLAMLDKYDASQPYYVGTVSENKETIDRLGIFAFGGGGLFLSMPLLKELRPYNEECIKMPDPAGDIRTYRCIYTYSTTKLTWEHYLFQMDIHGDLSGFYEAARTRPLNTHHWQSWHHDNMVHVGAVSKICGNECVLQKYITPDGWYMTNGYSIVKYGYNETEQAKYIEGAMEHTWADTAFVIPTSWNYTLAPLKPKDERKIQYKMEKVEEGYNSVTIFYVKRNDGLGEGIIRMTWEKPVDGGEF